MPDINGIKLAKQARVIRPNLFVLLGLAELIRKLKTAHQQTSTAEVD